MSVIKIDGFDGYGTPENVTNFQNRLASSGWAGSSPLSVSADTRTGIGFSAATGYYNTGETAFNPATGVIAGMAIKLDNLVFRRICAFKYDNYAGQVHGTMVLYANETGAISAFRVPAGSNYPGTLIGYTPVNSLYVNTWHYLEVKWASGSIEIRIDGNTVGVITDSAPLSSSVNLFEIQNGGVGGPTMLVDDLYLLRVDGSGLADFLGDCVVHTMFPLEDATPNDANQFGGGITHASAVNGLPLDENSAYLYSNTSNDTELFTITDLPTDMIDILAMQVNVRAKKDSAGVAKYKIALKSGATLSLSPDKTPTTSFHELSYLLESNPAGGAWTKVAAQAVKIGFKVS